MIKISDELIYDWTVGEAILKRFWQTFSQRVAEQAFMDIDMAITGPEPNVKSRLLELLEQHPELTRPQAYMQAVMEVVGYRGYLVPPELAPGVLARLEANDANPARKV